MELEWKYCCYDFSNGAITSRYTTAACTEGSVRPSRLANRRRRRRRRVPCWHTITSRRYGRPCEERRCREGRRPKGILAIGSSSCWRSATCSWRSTGLPLVGYLECTSLTIDYFSRLNCISVRLIRAVRVTARLVLRYPSVNKFQ